MMEESSLQDLSSVKNFPNRKHPYLLNFYLNGYLKHCCGIINYIPIKRLIMMKISRMQVHF